jgi:hypothetical protein
MRARPGDSDACIAGAQTAARVWDAFLCEGAKVLLRVALALAKLHEAAAVRENELGALVAALRGGAAACHDRDALLACAFGGIGALPGARVQRLRAAAAAELQREADALAARRAANRAAAGGA